MTFDPAIASSIARLPLLTRRRTLRALWHGGRLLGRLPQLGIERLLMDVLRVSRAEAKRLEQEIVYQDWITMGDWAALAQRETASLSQDAATIAFSDTTILERLSNTTSPVILAPLHMGCFALPFARLMTDFFAGRRMLILRAREDREADTAAMQRISEIGVDMRFLNVADKNNYVDAIKFARAGSVIVTFVDLPASYGGAAATELFGKPVKLAMGIAALARLTEATVVPMSVSSTSNGDTVRIGRPFQSFEKGPAEKQRVTELIRRHIEDATRDRPEQWHMWPRFSEFLDPDADSEAA